MSDENNFKPNLEGYKPLRPFNLFMKNNFPFIENTFEALDTYGLLCEIVKYLNTVIDNTNAMETNVTALSTAFNQLNDYVSHYFDNLDVQDEINNKLDEMVESGALQELVDDYFTYVTNLIAAQNTIISGQTESINGLSADITAINDSIDDINENLDAGYTIMIGDSYGVGQSSPNNTTGWCDLLKGLLDIPTNSYFKFVAGGRGFCGYSSNQDILSLLQSNIGNIDDTSKVKRMIIGIGINDYAHTKTEIHTAIDSFFTYVSSNLPNCKDITLFVTGYNNAMTELGITERKNMSKIADYYTYANKYSVKVINGVCYCLRIDNNMSSDNVHPTEDGYIEIANAMFNALTTGYVEFTKTELPNVMLSNSTINENVRQGELKLQINYFRDKCIINIVNKAVFNFYNNIDINTSDISSGFAYTLGSCNFTNFKPIQLIYLPINLLINIGGTLSTQPAILEINTSGDVKIRVVNPVSGVQAIGIDFSLINLPIEYV